MIALAVLALLNAIDAYLTVRVLDGGGAEANPIMRAAMERVGAWPALIFVKALMLVAVYAAGVEWLTWALCAGYGALCVWNWRVLRRQRRITA